MKPIRFFLAFALALFIAPINSFAAAEKTFDHYIPMDIDEEYWAYDEIDDFINADIINGYIETYEDGYVEMTVDPDNMITRAEFVKILVTALSLQSEGAPLAFSDVKDNNWYSSYVNIASSLGIIEGYDGKFGANDPITRDQITAIIVRAFDETIVFPEGSSSTFTDVKSTHWALEEINKAAGAGIVKGVTTTTFGPTANATRAQAIVMLHRAINKETADLPNEQELIRFVESHVKEENRLTEAKSFDELAMLYDANSIGFYRLYGKDSIEMSQIIEEDGTEMTVFANDENMNVNVLSMSTRMASIEVSGIEYTVSMKDETSSFEYTDNLDGVYSLIKDSSGNWKIYNFAPTFEIE